MNSQESVRYRGREIPVRGTIKVRGRVYRLLEDVGRGDRKRHWVYDRGTRDFRQILVLPRGKSSRQHIAVLKRVSQGNPNLPTIVDYEHRGDETFVVTNWVRGEDLKTYLGRITAGQRPWPSPLEIMKLYRGLAHGLCQMHRHRRVVHGDLKPANLVLTREPNRLVMIDFGSAWAVEHTTRRQSGDGISRRYAAPEQLREQASCDSRSDQFSATLVAYEMLTGVVPYGEMGGQAGLPEHRSTYESLYQPPSQLCPNRRAIPQRIWRLVDDVIARGLQLDPAERFVSQGPWLEALEDLHCEMRRKGRLTRVDSALLRWIGWLGDRTVGRVHR
jgi:serine/threonine protein kinase